MNQPFSLLRQAQLVTGRGSVAFLATLGAKRAAVLYDGRLLDEGRRADIAALLGASGCEARFVADIRNEPFFTDIESALQAVREFSPDLIVGLGGGSVMDTAKAVWLFYEHPELSFTDAFKPFQIPEGSGKAVLAAVPTTSGTGSETTCAAVFTDSDTMQKHLILGYSIIPAYAVLDADFTDTLPPAVAAHTGMDALSHATEAAVCKASSPLVVNLALSAALELFDHLPASVHAAAGSEECRAARESCHYAATQAGVAINNSSAGLVHALDQPGPFFNLPHGLVCGLLLPYATAFHSPHPAYATLARRLGHTGSDAEVCRKLVEHLWEFNTKVGVAHSFQELGIEEVAFMAKLEDFTAGLDGSMAANLSPQKPTRAEAREILRAAYYGEKSF